MIMYTHVYIFELRKDSCILEEQILSKHLNQRESNMEPLEFNAQVPNEHALMESKGER